MPSGRSGLNRTQKPILSVDEETVLAPFQFEIGAAGAVIAGSTKGDLVKGDAVKNGTAGNYTLTLSDRPAEILDARAQTTDLATPVDGAQVDYSNVVAGGTFVVQTYTAGAAANPASGKLVSGCLVVRRTKRSSRFVP